MPRLTHQPPKYRRHKASGQAIVTIRGTDHYLGPFGSKVSRAEYDRLVAEWLAHGRPGSGPAPRDLTVVELIADYLRYAKVYYQASNELANMKLALRPLKKLYGRTIVAKFGPLALKTVREAMIKDDLCRTEINKRIGRIKRVFRWGVENEIVPPDVFHGLQAVRGLARGRSQARESAPIRPVPEAFVDALAGHVLPPVWAMIQLQRLTGMRPGEVILMRSCDLDMSGAVWVYTPQKHKTMHHGHQRQIFLGPKAQEVVRPWLKTELEAYLFSPSEAMAVWRAEQHRQRKTPLSCGNRPGTNRKAKPKKQAGERYDVASYRRAIEAGCKKAEMPHWHPHQLRHNAATHLRKEYGLDVARVVLGHRSPAVTEVYAEVDQAKAMQVMGQVG